MDREIEIVGQCRGVVGQCRRVVGGVWGRRAVREEERKGSPSLGSRCGLHKSSWPLPTPPPHVIDINGQVEGVEYTVGHELTLFEALFLVLGPLFSGSSWWKEFIYTLHPSFFSI